MLRLRGLRLQDAGQVSVLLSNCFKSQVLSLNISVDFMIVREKVLAGHNSPLQALILPSDQMIVMISNHWFLVESELTLQSNNRKQKRYNWIFQILL